MIDWIRSAAAGRPSAVTAVLGAATLWGSIGPSYALLSDRGDATPIDIVTIRAVTATVLFCVWLLATRPYAFRISPRDVPVFLSFGLITVTAFYPVLIYAFEENGVATGALLLYLAPVLVTIAAALLLGEPLTRRKLGSIGLSLAGLALVVGVYRRDDLATSPLGIALGLASAVCYGAYSVMGKPLLARYPATTVLAYHLLAGTTGLVAFRVLANDGAWPSPATIALIGGYNGVFTTLVPIALYTIGLSRLPSSEASLLAMWEPAVAMLLATTLLNEALTLPQVVGALLILSSVVLLSLPSRTRAVPSRLPG